MGPRLEVAVEVQPPLAGPADAGRGGARGAGRERRSRGVPWLQVQILHRAAQTRVLVAVLTVLVYLEIWPWLEVRPEG